MATKHKGIRTLEDLQREKEALKGELQNYSLDDVIKQALKPNLKGVFGAKSEKKSSKQSKATKGLLKQVAPFLLNPATIGLALKFLGNSNKKGQGIARLITNSGLVNGPSKTGLLPTLITTVAPLLITKGTGKILWRVVGGFAKWELVNYGVKKASAVIKHQSQKKNSPINKSIQKLESIQAELVNTADKIKSKAAKGK